jgi:cell division protein FtsL
LESESARAKANALQQNINDLELQIRKKDEEFQGMQQKLDVYSSINILI